jgi:tetratricopeptide (TPR) repeat protein
MPTTTYMGVDPRHDHSMRIPRPDVAAKMGAPNACNNCHAKKTAQWAADAIRQWTGKPPASYQNFATALRAGSLAAPGARGALLGLIEDKSQPALVRASAIARLGRLLTPVTIDATARALNDPDSLVRLAAVEALANAEPATRQRYLSRMLGDPVRAVRVEAARALAGAPEPLLAESDRAAFSKALAEYVAVQTYNADRPESRMNLGNLYAQRADAAAAIVEYRKAVAIDPTFVPAYANLADLYRARGADGEAVAVLREGLARNPRAAMLHHALGLALVRQKQSAEGLKALRVANELAPDSARFAYVYAVALNDTGRTKDALQVLAASLKRDPYDRDVLSGLAFFTAQAGNRELALGYVKQLRELDPENAQYAQMEKQIEGAPLR